MSSRAVSSLSFLSSCVRSSCSFARRQARPALVMTRSCRCFWGWLLLSWLCCLLSPVASSARAVTHLPGFDGPLPFSLETGYVEVDESTGVRLFYYFVQSEKDPEVDPLLLWLTGGPGCSSLSGLTHEIGPFLFDAQGYRGGFPTLLYRPETWTKVSNVIFVDSPVGTGFSYAASEEGFKSSDTKAVKQLVVFLRKWLHEHPRFHANPLYIGGDSYGGFIVPTLTHQLTETTPNTAHTMGCGDTVGYRIVDNTQSFNVFLDSGTTIGYRIANESGETPVFNIKGYIVGNPVTDHQFDTDGKIPFLHGMGLISDELYEQAKESCRGKYSAPPNARCAESIQAIDDCTKDINGAHILEPVCEEVWSPKIAAATDGMSRLLVESADDLQSAFDCRKASYVLIKIWANDETVRESLGVHKGTVGAWKRCNYDIQYTNDISSTVEYHLRLTTKGYRAIVYSGDHDSSVSFVGTQAWIRSLNLSIVDDWRPWYVAGQVAGFTRSYSNNLTYATVKGAGHTAAEYKPKECLAMFVRWISGDPL